MSESILEVRGDTRRERCLRGFAGAAIAFMLMYPVGAAADDVTTTCQADTAPIVDYTHVFAANEAEAARNCPTAALLSTVAAWLSAHFDLPAADEAPRIAFVSPEQLRAMRYGPLRPVPQQTTRDEGVPHGGDRGVVAVYEDRTQTIYLARGWDQASPADVSVLVHEMVHHLQKRGGLKYTCPQEREKLAYQAQARWLAQTGRSLESEFEVDAFTLLASTTCMM
jgi:hypothetical protein